MADRQVQSEIQEIQEEQELKYLFFVQVLAMGVVLWFLEKYNFVKEKSCLLRPIICLIENIARPIAVPAYMMFRHVPIQLLKFADRKVDETLMMLENRLPAFVTLIAVEVFTTARFLAGEVRHSGVRETVTGIVKNAYVKYERQLEWAVVAAWRMLNYVPLFPLASWILLPLAVRCAAKYNRVLRGAAARGYRVSQYLPPVPLQRIARIFREAERQQAVRSIAAPTEAAAPAEAAAPTEIEVEAPAEAAAPTEIEVKAPAEAAAPTEIGAKALADAAAPTEIEVEAPAEAAAPTEIEVKAPAEAAAPTEIKVESPAEAAAPTEIKVQSPAEAAAPTEIGAKALADAAAPTEIEVEAPAEGAVPTEIEVKVVAEAAAPTEI